MYKIEVAVDSEAAMGADCELCRVVAWAKCRGNIVSLLCRLAYQLLAQIIDVLYLLEFV
jgi:hypothetical protein